MMKKNLYLFGVLIALLVGTYFFQEVRVNKLFDETMVKDHLLKTGELKSLSFGEVAAVKNGEQWWMGEQLLSHNVFNQIEKRIIQIKKIKDVQGESKSYFTHPFPILVNGEKWVIGDMTLDKSGFYFAQNDKVMVAVMEGIGTLEYSGDPEGAMLAKVEDLKKNLSFTLPQLKETQLFRYYPNLPNESVALMADGRPGYELIFNKNETIPAPIKGIAVHDKLFEKYTSLLTQMTIKEEVSFSEKLKHSKVGELKFIKGKEEVIWELWIPSANSANPYILDNKLKKAYLMVGGTLRIFFIGVQDYWDKKVIPSKSFEEFSRLPVTFIQGEKSAVVEVLNREPLVFETAKLEIDQLKMNQLFEYIFNLSQHDQADRVSQLSKSERKEVLSGNFLRLELMDQQLILWRKEQELIVVNLTQGFKAHFLIKDESFRASFEDVLK